MSFPARETTMIKIQDTQGRRLTIAGESLATMPQVGDHLHTHQLGTMRVCEVECTRESGGEREHDYVVTLDPIGALTAGTMYFDPQIGKDRRYLREASGGTFRGARIFAVQDHTADTETPVPWDRAEIFPWVVHIDVILADQATGEPRFVTFTMPSIGGPGTAEWREAELAAVKRLGVHEALESFDYEPHTRGGDCPECPAIGA
jgi:hypothetical protein